jgi:hypothetical protein
VTQPVACEGEADAVCSALWRDFDLEQHPPIVDGGGADAGAGAASFGAPADAGAVRDDATTDGEVDVPGGAQPKKRSSACSVTASRVVSERAWCVVCPTAAVLVFARSVRRVRRTLAR